MAFADPSVLGAGFPMGRALLSVDGIREHLGPGEKGKRWATSAGFDESGFIGLPTAVSIDLAYGNRRILCLVDVSVGILRNRRELRRVVDELHESSARRDFSKSR